MSAQVEILRYKAHKVVRAAKITELRPNGMDGAPTWCWARSAAS